MGMLPDELKALNLLITEHNQLVRHIERVEKIVWAATQETWYLRLYYWIRPLPWPPAKPTIIPHLHEDRITPQPITAYDVMPGEINSDHDMTAVWNMRKAQ